MPTALAFTLVTVSVCLISGVRAGKPNMSNPTTAQGRNPPNALHPPASRTHVWEASSHMYGFAGEHATTPRSPHSSIITPPPHSNASTPTDSSAARRQHCFSNWLIGCHLSPATAAPIGLVGAWVGPTLPIWAKLVGVRVMGMSDCWLDDWLVGEPSWRLVRTRPRGLSLKVYFTGIATVSHGG